MTLGDSDAFPVSSSGGEEPRARVAECQGNSQGVASANMMHAEPQVPLLPHPGRPVEFDRDDTDSPDWSEGSDEDRMCSEVRVEGVHEELFVDDENHPVRPSAVVTTGFHKIR